MEGVKPCFLSMTSLEKGAVLRGGALVTDGNTKPLEFRATDPVRPSQMQRVLYGNTINSHIAVEVIARPLISSLREKASHIIIFQPQFFSLQEHVEQPVLWVGKEEKAAELANTDDDNPMINSSSGKFDPLIVLGVKGREEKTKIARAELQKVFQRYNLLEPFSRIVTAINQVHNPEPVAD